MIVDLGAHHGEEYEWMLRKLGPLGAYIAVEADPRNAAVLRDRLKHSRGAVLCEEAIAAFDGKTTLHLCDNKADQAKGSSSTHSPTGHLKHFEWCTFEQQAEVRAVMLDTLIAGSRGWSVVLRSICCGSISRERSAT